MFRVIGKVVDSEITFIIDGEYLTIRSAKHPKRVARIVRNHLPINRLVRSMFAHHCTIEEVLAIKSALKALRAKEGDLGYNWGNYYSISLIY